MSTDNTSVKHTSVHQRMNTDFEKYPLPRYCNRWVLFCCCWNYDSYEEMLQYFNINIISKVKDISAK